MKQWGAVRCFCTALAFIISITPHTIGVSNILGNTKLDHNVHGKMLLAILRPDWKLTGKMFCAKDIEKSLSQMVGGLLKYFEKEFRKVRQWSTEGFVK